jgi:hypothetical protein
VSGIKSVLKLIQNTPKEVAPPPKPPKEPKPARERGDWWVLNVGFAMDTEGDFNTEEILGVQWGLYMETITNVTVCIVTFDYAWKVDDNSSYYELLISEIWGYNLGGSFAILAGGGLGVGWSDTNIMVAWKISAGTSYVIGHIIIDAIYSYGGQLGSQIYVGAGWKYK